MENHQYFYERTTIYILTQFIIKVNIKLQFHFRRTYKQTAIKKAACLFLTQHTPRVTRIKHCLLHLFPIQVASYLSSAIDGGQNTNAVTA